MFQRWCETLTATSLAILAVLLLLPACHRRVDGGARTQSINNLKQIALAMHGFHDANKRLAFNGTREAVGDDPTSGSWAFQVLPYIDQAALFHKPTGPGAKENGVAAYMCPGRGRPWCEEGKGPWSDYFINNYLNDPFFADKPDNADGRLTLVEIKDGTSNTICAGQGNITTTHYSKTKNVAGSSNIFAGGTEGTMRGGPRWRGNAPPRVAMQRDAETPAVLAIGGWGGPFQQGCLMCFCDGTVRMVPYRTPPEVVGAYLTPTGAEDVALPD